VTDLWAHTDECHHDATHHNVLWERSLARGSFGNVEKKMTAKPTEKQTENAGPRPRLPVWVKTLLLRRLSEVEKHLLEIRQLTMRTRPRVEKHRPLHQLLSHVG